MADTDLPASGKDTSWTISFDGVVKKLDDQVISSNVQPNFDEIVTKPLGSTGSQIDTVFTHYEITLELALASKEFDEMFDLAAAALEARTPSVIVATATTRYRDLTTKTYSYWDAKITGWRKRVQRGDKTTVSLTLKAGTPRIAT